MCDRRETAAREEAEFGGGGCGARMTLSVPGLNRRLKAKKLERLCRSGRKKKKSHPSYFHGGSSRRLGGRNG